MREYWCLRVLLQDFCKIFARSPRGICRGNAAKKNKKTLHNETQINQNGSQMALGTPSGEGRERGGKTNRKRDLGTLRNGSLFGPQNRIFFCFWLPGAFGVSAQISATTAISGIGPGAVRGAPASILSDFGCPRGPYWDHFRPVFRKNEKLTKHCKNYTIVKVLRSKKSLTIHKNMS